MYENLRLLYLDDDPLVVIDSAEHLEMLGFGLVEKTFLLQDAQHRAAETRFDIAILDFNVDYGQTSLSFATRLRAEGVRTVFASGNGAIKQDLMAQGHYFLDKPFTLPELTRMMEHVVQDLRASTPKALVS